MFAALLVTLVMAGDAASTQHMSAATCRWLTPDEASAVLGEGVTLKMAADNGACIYVGKGAQLQIAQPARMTDTRALRLGYESMKKDRRGEDEPGIGDAAFVASNRREIAFLKGNAFVVITIEGRGSEDRLVELKEAVRKIADRF